MFFFSVHKLLNKYYFLFVLICCTEAKCEERKRCSTVIIYSASCTGSAQKSYMYEKNVCYNNEDHNAMNQRVLHDALIHSIQTRGPSYGIRKDY